jgi:AraC-like DNA-binding protein
MHVMEMKRRKMVEMLVPHLLDERVVPASVKGVNLFRIDTSFPRTPKSYDPQIIIMAQGKKRVFLGDEIYTYDPSHYLVLSVPLPIECEAIATPEEPILGLSIAVDPLIVGDILLEMDDTSHHADSLPKGIYGASLTDSIADAAIRLLLTLSSPRDGRILGPMIVREIIYRVLCGENGGALQALAYRNRRFFQIARVLNKIHETYDDSLDVRTLAMEAGMSISAFHTSFKAVTNESPLQYIKRVRLHKARLLMNQEGLNAYSAALRVGYESPSQFNREYKRFFGITPAKDAVSLRSDMAESVSLTIVSKNMN